MPICTICGEEIPHFYLAMYHLYSKHKEVYDEIWGNKMDQILKGKKKMNSEVVKNFRIISEKDIRSEFECKHCSDLFVYVTTSHSLNYIDNSLSLHIMKCLAYDNNMYEVLPDEVLKSRWNTVIERRKFKK